MSSIDLKVHTLSPKPRSKKRKKRVGRGLGSGHGVTATRGTKGQKARSGGAKPPWFEGGQTPLYLRIPRRGFSNAPFRKEYEIVNVSDLEKSFNSGDEVTPEKLYQLGLIDTLDLEVKILGKGKLTKALKVKAHKFSEKAKSKIESAGGSVEVLPPLRKKWVRPKKKKTARK